MKITMPNGVVVEDVDTAFVEKILGLKTATTVKQVVTQNKKKGGTRIKGDTWTVNEEQYLRDHQSDSFAELANALGRTKKAIKARFYDHLHLKHLHNRNIETGQAVARAKQIRGNSWTSEDDRYLTDHKDDSFGALAKVLGRTRTAVEGRFYNVLKLKRGDIVASIPLVSSSSVKHRHGKERHCARWTGKEDEFLRINHMRIGVGRMAKALKRTKNAVSSRLYALGLKG